MQELIIYLLKSAGLLSLFYGGYYFLLRKDTAFRSNRYFLLAGIVTSLLLPLLQITRTVEVEATAAPMFLENLTATTSLKIIGTQQETNWWQIAAIAYLLGLGFFLLKFLGELFSLLKLIYTTKAYREGNFHILNKRGTTQPFSFFKYIVLDPHQHTPAELNLILRHEKSHARQWHSIDQLFSSLFVYLLWFNPLAWLYKKAVVQNLEYLADQEVVAARVSKKEYQKTLLKISVTGFKAAFTNQFYQSFIKKRIIMLNKNATQKSNFWKTGILLPFILFFIFSFNIKTEAREIVQQNSPQISKAEVSVYVTKESSEKDLRAFKRLFDDQGIDLIFEDLNYSASLLTNVKVTFKKRATGTTGNLTLSNPRGIAPLLISTNGKEIVMTPEATLPTKSNNPLEGIGNSPLYIIAGKEYKTSQLTDKYVQLQGEWRVLKPEEAIKQYGKKAKDGAILVAKENIVEDFKEALKSIDFSKMPLKQSFIHVKKNEAPILVGVDSKIKSSRSSAKTRFEAQEINFHRKPEDIIATQNDGKQFYFQNKNPLIVIEGEVKDKDVNVSAIEPSTIKSMVVLKGDAAAEKYGEKGKDGVIEIDLKSKEEQKATAAPSEKKTKFKTVIATKMEFYDSKQNRKSLTVRDVGSADPDAAKPLYVVDGKVMVKGFDPETISKEEIESIVVLKSKKTTAKYGDQALNGVIEITTKK